MTGYKYSLPLCTRYLLYFKELLAPVFIGLHADLMGKTGGFEAFRAVFLSSRVTTHSLCLLPCPTRRALVLNTSPFG